MCISFAVGFAGHLEQPVCGANGDFYFLVGLGLGIGVLTAGIGSGEVLAPAPRKNLARVDSADRILFLVLRPAVDYDFFGVDLHAQAIGLAEVHVKLAVCGLGLLKGRNLRVVALHIPEQFYACIGGDFLADFLHGGLFPHLCAFGLPESSVNRNRYRFHGACPRPARI